MATATLTDRESATLVTYRTEGNIAILELSDPPANTYTHQMMRQLDEAILKARFDNDVQVIVLRGAGEKFFSAGANIKMLNEVDPTFKYYFCLHANETLSRLEQMLKLVIAALNGHCVGGGPPFWPRPPVRLFQLRGFPGDLLAREKAGEYLLAFLRHVSQGRQLLKCEVCDLVVAGIGQPLQLEIQAGQRLLAISFAGLPHRTVIAFPVLESIPDSPQVLFIFRSLILPDRLIHSLQPGAPWFEHA